MDKGDRKLHASKVHKEKEEESFLNRRKELFRRLPKIDRLMGMELTKELTEQYGYRAVLEAARKVEEPVSYTHLDVYKRQDNKLPARRNWQPQKHRCW